MKPNTATILPTVLTAALALAVSGATGCARKGAGGGGPPRMPPAVVQLVPAQAVDVPLSIDTFGHTEERASVDVVPQVSGILVRSLIRDGDTVTNGQPLFLIDASDYEARARQIESLLAADIANRELARTTVERNRPLLEKKLISPEAFDTLKTKLAAAEAQVKADQSSLDLAEMNLARCTVTSSVDGVCSKRFVDDGNLVGAGQSRLTNIRSYDPLEVEFSLPEQHLDAVRQALAKGEVRIELTPKDSTNRYDGRLTFVDNAVNAQAGTILLRGELPNADRKLWSRQFVDVRVIAGTVPGAIMVPESAVQFGKRGPYLYVATPEGKADLRPVKLGVRYENRIQVLQGVAAGEAVVALGQFMLYPGAAVMDASKLPPAGGMPGGPGGGPGAAAGGGKPGEGKPAAPAGNAAAGGPPAATNGTAGGGSGR